MDRIDRRFSDDGCVYDENGSRVSPFDDDYGFCKAEQAETIDRAAL